MKIKSIFAVLVAVLAAACSVPIPPPAPPPQADTQAAPPPPALPQATNDTVVTSRVQTALAKDPQVGSSKIAVNTTQGRVTLTGDIRSMELRKKAEMIVRGVEGVRAVDNQLVITG